MNPIRHRLMIARRVVRAARSNGRGLFFVVIAATLAIFPSISHAKIFPSCEQLTAAVWPSSAQLAKAAHVQFTKTAHKLVKVLSQDLNSVVKLVRNSECRFDDGFNDGRPKAKRKIKT
jgi:hypothetical protein